MHIEQSVKSEGPKLTFTAVDIAQQVITKLKSENRIVQQGILKYTELDSKGYSYHNSTHTENVLKTAITLALSEGIDASSRKMELVAIAAVYHDLGFISQQFKNEPVGAQMAKEAMVGSYNNSEIDLVHQAILDTQMLGTPSGGFKQFATKTNFISCILCDSDTFNLSTESFFNSSIAVYNERFPENPVKNMSELGTRSNGISFLKGVTGILNEHEYYSKSGFDLGNSQKEKNKLILERYITECEK